MRFLQYALVHLALLFSLALPGIGKAVAQSGELEKYGLTDLPYATYQSGTMNLPCLGYLRADDTLMFYAAEVKATNGIFPIIFEVENLTVVANCDATSYLRHTELTGTVVLPGSGDENVGPIPYMYTMTFLGAGTSGKYQLEINHNALFRILEKGDAISGIKSEQLGIVPAYLDSGHTYELRDANTNALLNGDWNLQFDNEVLTVVPTSSGEGNVSLIDLTANTIQHFSYSIQEPVLAPSLTLLKKSRFGGVFGSEEYEQISIPYICRPENCSNVARVSIIGSTTYKYATYRLVAEGQDYVVSTASAKDINWVAAASITGLQAGQVIKAGDSVDFTLNAGLTSGRTALLQWEIAFEGIGAVLIDTLQFTSN